MNVHHSQLETETLENSQRQSFCEDISKLHGRRDEKELDEAIVNLLSHDMTVDFYVFGAFVEDRIRSDLNGGLIIAIKSSWLNEGHAEILKKKHEPLQFTGSGS